MSTVRITSYGEWESPISARMPAAGSLRLGGVAVDGEDVLWVEGRPSEGGRGVLVRRRPDGTREDVVPEPFSVRSRAHEYGGGAFLAAGGHVWFVNFADQRIYHTANRSGPEPLTAGGPFCYADLVLDRTRQRLLCIREDHSGDGDPANELVAVALASGEVTVLVRGHDFYSTPVLSPDGNHLAWLTWDHPAMPWDETTLWLARIDAGGLLGSPERIAGGGGVSLFQPAWSPSGKLFVVADPGGWWNLHVWENGHLRCLLDLSAEFGLPQWTFGMHTYGFASDGSIVCAYSVQGEWRLGRLEPETGDFHRLGIALTQVDDLAVSGGRVVVIGASPRQAAAVLSFDWTSGTREVLRESVVAELDSEEISEPERIEFPVPGGETAFGFFYPPKNRRHRAPEEELPPLLVTTHGGPTAAASTGLNLKLQYWTSRGFAVLDVNYRGSTGYGRAYREMLKGRWGVADVEDCVEGALHLVRTGRADGNRLIIRGGSAGGYTTLAALTFRDVFRAGASYYGIGDLETLVRDTHKFESRYLDQLVGPYPEQKALYRARSPIHSVDRLSCPVIFFQGLDDKVVPPSQTEAMVTALRAKGIPVAYLAFEEEQHGFRKAPTIKRTLEAELYFYGRIFGFTPADEIEPVVIENL